MQFRILLLLFLILQFSCFAQNNNPNIYIAGIYNTSDNSESNICYWKNGTRYDLMSGPSFNITGFYVYDNDIYLSGYYFDKDDLATYACYWKNGQRHDLINSDSNITYSSAFAIFITD